MVTIVCQYTRVEFEANSKRSKNHPAVSALLNEAAKNKYNPNAYRTAVDALAEAKANGMTDISEIIAFAQDRINSANDVAYQRRIEAEQAKKARDEQRRLLKAHGYYWHREDEESMDFAGPNAFDGQTWTLYGPDHRSVTVAEALEKIRNA